ncbi:Origin recognition complex subunit 3 [Grifola frondosa]|uniref:Origin recognition complex subunit 3 n=1 Tax=Grifola frondosa TaxID=5627 RepID=A0A1C7LSF0_GRIFR|nr:Origin recognition complex subunit 3 [Grifola frondosa]
MSSTCIYIPPTESGGDDRSGSPSICTNHTGLSHEDEPGITPSYSSFQVRDLPDGPNLRLEAYRVAWARCFNHIHSIIRTLHATLTAEIVDQINMSYTDVLPGLPYPEGSVIAVHAQGGSSSLYANVMQQLDDTEDEMPRGDVSNNPAHHNGALHIHLYPANCPNLVATMKAIVTGFVDCEDGPVANVKRKPTTSLANYDINLLRAWYDALGQYTLSCMRALWPNTFRPKSTLQNWSCFCMILNSLIPLLCKTCFTSAGIPSTVRLALYKSLRNVDSMHIPRLPLVFLLDLSSPTTPSYIHRTYPRSTLALLRVRLVSAPSGATVVKEVLDKVDTSFASLIPCTDTFFDVDFEPDIMPGARILDYIIDFTTRHDASLDALITMLQLAYMRHFDEPLTCFASDELLGTTSLSLAASKLQSPASRPFLDSLHTRIVLASNPDAIAGTDGAPPRAPDAAQLLTEVSAAHTEFRRRARGMRIALRVARIVQRVGLGHQGTRKDRDVHMDDLEMLSLVLRGRVARELRKLSVQQLHAVLAELHAFFHELASPVLRREEEDARVRIVSAMAQLPPDDLIAEAETPTSPAVTQVATSVAEWLVEYLGERFTRLEDCALWDVWYTGSSPFPAELMRYMKLVNPAPRVTVVSALLRPHDFMHAYSQLKRRYTGAAESTDEGDDDTPAPTLWMHPDTSILFRRYMEAGRMVNVYDWFESFAVVLEDQRRRQNGKGDKGKEKAGQEDAEMDVDEDGEDVDEDAEAETDGEEAEHWKVEVQARFIRALHELDYMGFVKHTGRKADHVIRTVYDVPD